jgi:hypothetical protein
MGQLPCMNYRETLRHLYSPSFTILSIINLNQMKRYYQINVFFSVYLFLASMCIMVATFTLANPSKEILGCMCILFTSGILGSYCYYSNAKEWKAKINNQIK